MWDINIISEDDRNISAKTGKLWIAEDRIGGKKTIRTSKENWLLRLCKFLEVKLVVMRFKHPHAPLVKNL